MGESVGGPVVDGTVDESVADGDDDGLVAGYD